MRLFSNDFKDGDKMPVKHVFNGMGHHGGNLSPHLQWDNIPIGTKSFVVTCYDPDAPTGSGWWHWIVANIPAEVNYFLQGYGSNHQSQLSCKAIQTRTDFGCVGYNGPAPPAGKSHRYIFTVHALNIHRINIDENSSGAMVGFHVYFHQLDKASITVIY